MNWDLRMQKTNKQKKKPLISQSCSLRITEIQTISRFWSRMSPEMFELIFRRLFFGGGSLNIESTQFCAQITSLVWDTERCLSFMAPPGLVPGRTAVPWHGWARQPWKRGCFIYVLGDKIRFSPECLSRTCSSTPYSGRLRVSQTIHLKACCGCSPWIRFYKDIRSCWIRGEWGPNRIWVSSRIITER